MRLIDADALVREICRDQCERKYDDCDGMCEMVAYAENAPTIGGWISVKDRLPEAEGHYLAAYKLVNGEAFCDIMYYGFMDFKADEGMCFYKYDSEWGDVKYDGVTHWMRIPEIPKEDKGND